MNAKMVTECIFDNYLGMLDDAAQAERRALDRLIHAEDATRVAETVHRLERSNLRMLGRVIDAYLDSKVGLK